MLAVCSFRLTPPATNTGIDIDDVAVVAGHRDLNHAVLVRVKRWEKILLFLRLGIFRQPVPLKL